MPDEWPNAICILIATCIVLRIARRSCSPRVRAWTRIGVIVFYAVGLWASPSLREGFLEVGCGIGFLLVLPIIVFGAVVAMAAPIVKGGKPPEIF